MATRSLRSKFSGGVRRLRRRPGLEALEGRLLLATRVWDGGSRLSSAWTSALNWQDNTAPVAGDDLVFPAGAARQINTNDFSAGTRFNSIRIEAPDYVLGGNRINLGPTLVPVGGIATTLVADFGGGPGTSRINLPLTLPAERGVTIGSGTRLELAGVVSGAGGLVKSGAGILALSAPNSYQGLTTLRDGVTVVELGGTLGTTGNGTRINGGELVLNGVQIGEAIQISDAGTSPFPATVSTIASSVVTGPVSLVSLSRIRTQGAGSLLFAGVVSGGGELRKGGQGTLRLSANNTYTGLTRVSEGAVQVLHSNALGATSAGTIVEAGAALEVAESIPTGSEFPVAVVSAEPLDLRGSGIGNSGALRNLGGDNTWSGPITLTGDVAIGVDIESGPFTPDQLSLSGAITGDAASGLTKLGPGRLRLTGSFGGPAKSYAGTTTVAQGALRVLGPATLGATTAGTVVLTGAALEVEETVGPANVPGGMAGFPIQTQEPLTLNGTGLFNTGALRNVKGINNLFSGPVTLASDTTIGVESGATTQISGRVSGPGSLTKAGDGRLNLITTLGNPLTSSTTLNAGTLQVDASQPGSATTVNIGRLEGTGSIGSLTTFGGTVAPGRGIGTGILTATNGATLNPGTTFEARLDGTTPGTSPSGHDQLRVNGAVNLNNATLIVDLKFMPTTGNTFTVIDNDGTDPVVGTFNGRPEGSTFTVGTWQFTITYLGGTNNNDVVLIYNGVMGTNRPPMLEAIPGQQVAEGATLTIPVRATDPDADVLLFSLGPDAPAGARIDPATGVLTFTPAPGTEGDQALTVVVTDNGPAGASDSETVSVRVVGPPPTVTVRIDDGSGQRSRITRIAALFSEPVTIQPGAFELATGRRGRRMVPLTVETTTQSGRTLALLTFSARGIVGGSLPDGTYRLTLRSDRIADSTGSALDGNGDGTPGGDQVLTFSRRFGDLDGNGRTDREDLRRFNAALGTREGDAGFLAAFDFDGDRVISRRDARQLRRRLSRR